MVVQRVREDRKETMEFQVKVSGGRRWKSRLHFLLRKTRSEKVEHQDKTLLITIKHQQHTTTPQH